jgi:hypothetical protein
VSTAALSGRGRTWRSRWWVVAVSRACGGRALAAGRLSPVASTSPYSSGVPFDVPSADSKPMHQIESTARRIELFFRKSTHKFPYFPTLLEPRRLAKPNFLLHLRTMNRRRGAVDLRRVRRSLQVPHSSGALLAVLPGDKEPVAQSESAACLQDGVLSKIDHRLSLFITLGEPLHPAKRNSRLHLSTLPWCWGGRGHLKAKKGAEDGPVWAPESRTAVESSRRFDRPPNPQDCQAIKPPKLDERTQFAKIVLMT